MTSSATSTPAAASSRPWRSGAALASFAQVPLSEMFGYVGDLRSKTQGRASYSMQFDSYAEVPNSVAKEIIAKRPGSNSTPGPSRRAA